MSLFFPGTKVAVLRGGPSSLYDVSLKTGANVLSILRGMSDTYHPLDIFISKDGEWHKEGLVHEPHQALAQVDVVFNAMHGAYGEDGEVQKLLESLKIPFTGSGSLSSALSMHKGLTKGIYTQNDLLTPQHELLKNGIKHDELVHIFQNYLHPVIVKPATGGASQGMKLAHSYKELEEAVQAALTHSDHVVVEEYIKGKQGTCGVVENVRGQKLYALIPIEIRETEEVCPGSFTHRESEMITEMAKTAHEVLGLRHYSKSDFIITPKGKVYILETNSLPSLTKDSLIPQALTAVGWKHEDFIDHCLQMALKSK